MSNIVGTASYASGEQEIFTDSKKFIKTVKEELPYRSTSGFTFRVMNADAATRKAVDDLVYNEYGEENPHDLAHYQSTKGEHMEKVSEALNTTLYEKMFAEQETYRDWLLSQPPVYPYPASYAYAHEHGELEQYRSSHKANIACRDAIDAAIADHYRNNSLGNGAVKQVVDRAQISQDFLLRASSKDQDRLFSMLPFQSLTFSGIKDRKDIFAMIFKEENRNQTLRKPSVRKKLEKTTDEPKLPTSKKRGLER